MNRKLLVLLGFVLLASTVFDICAHTDTNTKKANANNKESQSKSIYETGELYLPSEDQNADVDKTLNKALKNNKLALIVMGANWCHDSRSLASKLYQPDVKEIIDANYELVFVDVGYMTNIKNIITRFGMPVIYATPTVLIVDPKSNQLINADNMHIWRSAATLSILQTIEYFTEVAKNKQTRLAALSHLEGVDMAKLKMLNLSINDFEQQQADRIYKAYTIVGPLLKELKETGKAKDFEQNWGTVAQHRYQLTDDLTKLRKQAVEIASQKSSRQKLAFPKYQAFKWESPTMAKTTSE